MAVGTDQGGALGPAADGTELASSLLKDKEDELEEEEASSPKAAAAPAAESPDVAVASTAPEKGVRPEKTSRLGVPGRVGPVSRPTVADLVIASVTCRRAGSYEGAVCEHHHRLIAATLGGQH